MHYDLGCQFWGSSDASDYGASQQVNTAVFQMTPVRKQISQAQRGSMSEVLRAGHVRFIMLGHVKLIVARLNSLVQETLMVGSLQC